MHPYTRALLAVVPHADLDHPLDFDRIDREMSGEGEPPAWEGVFTPVETLTETGDDDPDAADRGMEMVYISPTHRVRVRRGTDPQDVLALGRAHARAA